MKLRAWILINEQIYVGNSDSDSERHARISGHIYNLKKNLTNIRKRRKLTRQIKIISISNKYFFLSFPSIGRFYITIIKKIKIEGYNNKIHNSVIKLRYQISVIRNKVSIVSYIKISDFTLYAVVVVTFFDITLIGSKI